MKTIVKTLKAGKVLSVLAAVEGAAAYIGVAQAIKQSAKNPEHPGFWNKLSQSAAGTAVNIPFAAASLFLWDAEGMDIPVKLPHLSRKRKSGRECLDIDDAPVDAEVHEDDEEECL